MFLKNSRYYKQKVIEVNGVKAVKLRRLPVVEGEPVETKSNDRLDIMAQRQYNNPTMFWYIADANSRLEANRLVAEAGKTIDVPEQ